MVNQAASNIVGDSEIEKPEEAKQDRPSVAEKQDHSVVTVTEEKLKLRKRNRESSQKYRNNKRQRMQEMEVERNDLKQKNQQLKEKALSLENQVILMKSLVCKHRQ